MRMARITGRITLDLIVHYGPKRLPEATEAALNALADELRKTARRLSGGTVTDTMLAGHCAEVLRRKAAEYAPDGDRFGHFREAADLTGEPEAYCAWMFCIKHIASLTQMQERGVTYPEAVVLEKVGDALNYLTLIEEMAAESRIADLEKATRLIASHSGACSDPGAEKKEKPDGVA